MSAKEILRKMFNDYFIICTGIVISQVIFCLIFNTEAFFTLTEMGYVIFSSAIFTLPHWIYWSRKAKELSKKEIIVRQIVHIFVLIFMVVGYGHLVGWLNGFVLQEHIVMVVSIMFVYVMVRLFSWRRDMMDSKWINERLAELQKGDEGE
jgi:small-conductance mechanosensitive channel